MAPLLPDGAFALFRKRSEIKLGQIVLVRHPRFGLIVKCICSIELDGVSLKGLSSASTSTERLGRIKPENIVGRLIWHDGQCDALYGPQI